MKLETLTMQSVKSITQRSLLWHWNELARGRPFPDFSQFHPDARMHDPQQLLIWAVEQTGSQRRFRARYHGSRLTEVFRSAWIGKTMDEVLPECFRQFAVDGANACADSGCAIFSIVSTVDEAGNRVDCERLLLPFGAGAAVEQIVSSMQLISLKGNFERRTVLDSYRLESRVELNGYIPAGFSKPVISKPGLIVELDNVAGPIREHVAQRLTEASTRSTISGASPR